MDYDSDFLPYPATPEQSISYAISSYSLFETKPVSLIFFPEVQIILKDNKKFNPVDTIKFEILKMPDNIIKLRIKNLYGIDLSFLVDLLNKNNIVDTDVVSVYGANKESLHIVNLTCLCKQQLRNKTSNKSISR